MPPTRRRRALLRVRYSTLPVGPRPDHASQRAPPLVTGASLQLLTPGTDGTELMLWSPLVFAATSELRRPAGGKLTFRPTEATEPFDSQAWRRPASTQPPILRPSQMKQPPTRPHLPSGATADAYSTLVSAALLVGVATRDENGLELPAITSQPAHALPLDLMLSDALTSGSMCCYRSCRSFACSSTTGKNSKYPPPSSSMLHFSPALGGKFTRCDFIPHLVWRLTIRVGYGCGTGLCVACPVGVCTHNRLAIDSGQVEAQETLSGPNPSRHTCRLCHCIWRLVTPLSL